MGEIIDTSLTASHWSDRHGDAHQLGEIQVDDDEVVSGDALDDREPSEEDFEDYTGNAGMTLERWYHRAAIVIWPRDQHFAVLCGAGTEAAVGGAELHRDFAKLCRRHGLRAFEAELALAIDAASQATLLRNARLLHLLCRQSDHDKRDVAVRTRLCRSAVAALERFDAQPPENAWEAEKLDRYDVTHVTERRGRPFTLVCTKTTASYERACKTFERDKRNLARVVGIEEGLG